MAPPPYSMSQTPNPALGETQSDTNIDDDEATWGNISPNPVTIHIDASVSVQGNSNTIIMASGTGSQHPGPSTTSTSPSPTTMTTNMASTTAVLQTTQKHRQAKLTEMATSIIAALQSSRDLSQGTDGTGGTTPVEINRNIGVKIEGSRNVLCAGGGGGDAGRILPRKNNNKNNNNHEPVEDEANSNRKRRSQSEPIDTPKPRKSVCRRCARNNSSFQPVILSSDKMGMQPNPMIDTHGLRSHKLYRVPNSDLTTDMKNKSDASFIY